MAAADVTRGLTSLIEPPTGLKCKSREANGTSCEFYGSTVWSGYCSKCYKLYVTTSTNSTRAPHKTNAGVLIKNTGEVLMKDVGEKIQQPANKIKEIAQSQAEQVKLKLKSMKFGSQGNRLYKECDQLIEQCLKSGFTFEELQKSVQLFYTNLDNFLSTCNADEADQEEIIQSFEDYLSTRLHAYFFSKFSHLEEADKVLQKRISNLYWVTAEQLESPLIGQVIARDPENIGATLDKAMAALMLIHTKKTPREKLLSIDEACDSLNLALQTALQRPASADDFLPSFVLIMLNSKPPQLESNAAFIDCLSHPVHVTQGLSAYNFNTFQVALHYISKEINSVSLKLAEADFEKLMRGETTRKIMFTDMLNSLEVKMAQLEALNCRHQQLMRDVKSLTSSITQFRSSMKSLCGAGHTDTLMDNMHESLDQSAPINDNEPRLSLEQMAGDFDYFAKPSIDAILSSSSAAFSSLDEPLRPTTAYVSHTNLNALTDTSSQQCTSLPLLQPTGPPSTVENGATVNGPKTSSDLF